MSNIVSFTNLVYLVLGIATIIGGVLVLRRSSTKAANDAMERLNKTLDEEISALRRRVDDLERERATQDRVIATIRYVLKQYNLRVTIQGDIVTINDNAGKSKSMRVQTQPIPTVADDSDN